MLRRLSFLPALVAVAATLVAPSAAPAHAADDSAPLTITIDSLSPSYIPKKGPIRVSGSITNHDDVPWSAVRVYSFIGDTPMTTPAELADAMKVDPAAEVGARVTTPGTYDTLDRIDPGQSRRFSIKVPRSELHVDQPGVYWFGIHALGETSAGRLDGADGRARTFIPLVPSTGHSVDTALVVPLRHEINRTADGRLEDVGDWTQSLAPGGQLRSLVDFGAAAGSRPITWLVDPALPDAVRWLAAGNPPRALAPTAVTSPGASPSAGATSAPGATSDGGTSDEQSVDTAAVDASNAWLGRLHEALGASQILALPYGDLDVAAAAQHDPELYRRARKRSGSVLRPWGLRMTPAISSPSGYLDAKGMGLADRNTTVLVTDRMFGTDAPPVATHAGTRLITSSSGAARGGPGPGSRLAPMAMRQRIVSEAALRLLQPGRPPLVVVVPPYWRPSSTAGFFEGLDTPWLHLTDLNGATQRPARPVTRDEMTYPGHQARRELDRPDFRAAEALIRAGDTLQNVLKGNEDVASVVADEALAGTSYASRLHPVVARAGADRSRAWIDSELASIRVSAPRAVYLSSESGRFAATITNGLDQPVTVSLKALADAPLTIAGPTKVDIGPRGRATVLLTARTGKVGVHTVTLMVTDGAGAPLGSSDQLPIRSAQVSGVIWLILGTGVALLFGAIAVRLFRRLRARRIAGGNA